METAPPPSGRNLNYWDSISTLASEVDNPGRTFPRALAVAMILTVGMYISVLGVAVGTAPDGQSWDSSELADAGAWVAGEWLKVWIVVCSLQSRQFTGRLISRHLKYPQTAILIPQR